MTTNEGTPPATPVESEVAASPAPGQKRNDGMPMGLEVASLLMPALAMVGAQMDSQKREMEKLAESEKRRCARRRGRHRRVRICKRVTEVRWVRYEIGPLLAGTVFAISALAAALISKVIG